MIPDTWFGFEQEYFLYKDGAPLGFPRRRLPAAAGRVLHRRRLQERRRHRPRDRRTRTSTSASTPASTTKASTPKWRRASGSSRSSARAPRTPPTQVWIARYLLLRLCEKYGVDVNCHCKPLGNGRGLERLGHAHELLDQAHARSGRQGVLRGAHGGVRQVQERAHRRLWPGQSPAPDRSARDAVDRQVQLRRRRPRRLGARAAQLRQQTATTATSRIAVRTRRPIPTRSPAASCRRSDACPSPAGTARCRPRSSRSSQRRPLPETDPVEGGLRPPSIVAPRALRRCLPLPSAPPATALSLDLSPGFRQSRRRHHGHTPESPTGVSQFGLPCRSATYPVPQAGGSPTS